MNHLLIIGIRYENERPIKLIQKIVDIFDKSNVVDLNSDEFTTELIESNGVKSFAVNCPFKSKDFKTAVYETLTRANKIGQYWEVQGPMKIKRNFFMMNLTNEKNEIPEGVLGYRIILTMEHDK